MSKIQAVRVVETGKFWGGDELLAGVTVEGLAADWHAIFPAAEATVVAKKIREAGEVEVDEQWLNVSEAMIASWEESEDEYYAGQRIDY